MLARTTEVRPGDIVPQRVTLTGQEEHLESIPSVTVALEDDSRVIWRVTVLAELVKGDLVWLGELVTRPPSTPAERYRVLAEASCPGAKRWTLEILANFIPTPADRTQKAFLTVAACPDLLAPGLTALPSAAVLVGARPGVTGGVLAAGNTTVLVGGVGSIAPDARLLTKVAATQVGTGGTITLAGQPDLLSGTSPIAPNGSLSLDFAEGARCPVSITFGAIPVGGGMYVVEYLW